MLDVSRNSNLFHGTQQSLQDLHQWDFGKYNWKHRHSNRGQYCRERSLVEGKWLKLFNVFKAALEVDKRADLGCSEELFFMTLAMQHPFLVKLRAMDLTENSVLQYSLAAKLRKPGDKENKWTECDKEQDSGEDGRGNLEVH